MHWSDISKTIGTDAPLIGGLLAGALSVQWGVALTVLGVNVAVRSVDKKNRNPHAKPGLISQFINRRPS